MVVTNRETGIGALGALPWGSHICIFYSTKQDMIDVLVPYFKAGLENNEFCLWITAEPLSGKGAREAMEKTIPDFSRYLASKQIKIIPHTDWYLKGDIFNGNIVLNAWIHNLARAMASGYDGLRLSGDTTWVEKKDWNKFIDYEKEINKTIGKNHVLVLCTYPFDKCKSSEFIDVMNSHRYAFLVQAGEKLALKPKTVREMNQQLTSARATSFTPLMKRFTVSGLKGFSNPEIIELFLSICPSLHQKYPLPQIIKKFRNIRELLAASPEELEQAGLDLRCIPYIKLFHEIPARVLEEKIKEQPIYDSPEQIADYCYYLMRDLKKEVFKVIFLNVRNQIMEVIDLFEGSTDKIAIDAREVVEKAIAHNPTSLIFIHNHPSGDPTPSHIDKQTTRDLVFAGNIVQIRVLDHIIIGENRYFSFAQEGLIREYETDFVNLKLTGTSEAKRRLSKTKFYTGTHVIYLIFDLLFAAGFASSLSSIFFT
jgi:DNA repair protein RadC